MDELRWMIYGANGYTGRWIAREAVARGMKPVLAGRNGPEIKALAGELGCQHRVFSLDRAAEIAANLAGVRVLLHCAGPFSATSAPMIDACLAAKVHYLDITGEIQVIEAAAERHGRAVEAGVILIPAVGFDVVPSDCLAAMLAQRLPDATHLQLAFTAPGRISRGTARTIVEGLPQGACVRLDGRIVKVPIAWKAIEIPFRDGPRQAITVPWGDVAAAWYTTRIPNIEVYTALPPRQITQLRRLRRLFPVLGWRPIRGLLGPVIRHFLMRPTAGQHQPDRASFWGRVCDAQGRSAEATLETPGGYRLTVATALAAVERVMAGAIRPGFSTPALAFGADFILGIPDTDLRW